MLIVELVGLLRIGELAHFQFGNGETVLINCIDDLSSLGITVWLHHGESPGGSGLKLVLGEKITIVHKSKLSRPNSDDRSEEELSSGDALGSHSFHERSSLLDVILHSNKNLSLNLPFQRSSLLGRK